MHNYTPGCGEVTLFITIISVFIYLYLFHLYPFFPLTPVLNVKKFMTGNGHCFDMPYCGTGSSNRKQLGNNPLKLLALFIACSSLPNERQHY